jgi:hypothetical protein
LNNRVKSGAIYSSRRHIDIRLLPSLVPYSAKNETAHVIEPELTARITKLKKLIDGGVIDQDSSCKSPLLQRKSLVSLVTGPPPADSPKSTCPFTFYAQLHYVDVPEDLMQELEEETQRPTGIWTVKPPKLSLTGLLISKECGVIYEVTNTEGLRYIVSCERVRNAIVHNLNFPDHGLFFEKSLPVSR